MKNNNILASVALFGELYDSKKDIYDVISEFIKASILAEGKWTFTATELAHLLEIVFDFKIPDAVIKSTLKHRLKRDKLVDLENGVYTYIGDKSTDKFLTTEFQTMKENQLKIFQSLVLYVEKVIEREMNDREKLELQNNFVSYLLDKPVTEYHAQCISSFIIGSQNREGFTDVLNSFKEGLVLYTGIRYTADLNDLGSWNYDLNIYLDTEHLFNAVGFNGIIYSQIFNDFFNLVLDINNSQKGPSSRKRIELKYFEEVKAEVDNFFYSAQKILEGKGRVDPSKTAMITILNGCKVPSDVVNKKAKFYDALKGRGIHLENKVEYYKDHSYVVEDGKILEMLREEGNSNGRHLNEDECIHYLKLFTKINVLRKGVNNVGFDRIGHVLVTANRVAQYLSFHPLIKHERDTPFASDIDFVTDRFWFKLKKGFNDKAALPKSFAIITKAQIVLSSQLHSSISKKYHNLTEQVKKGLFNQEQALSAYSEFREMHKTPEEITIESIEDTLKFLNEDSLERHISERTMLQKKIEEGEAAKRELRRRDYLEKTKKKAAAKRRTKLFQGFNIMIFLLLTISASLILYTAIKMLRQESDTPLSIFGLILTFVIEIPLFIMIYKRIKRWFRRKIKSHYILAIQRLD